MRKVTFYHAGCPVCISAEDDILELVNPNTYIRVVHLGEEKQLIKQAEDLGVKSVPALVTSSGNVLHINFGASIDDLKG